MSAVYTKWEKSGARGRGVEPAEADRKALAAEQRAAFIQRHPYDIGVGADHLDHERSRDALHGIAARLAAPFTRADIGLDVLFGEALEAHASFDQTLAKSFLRRDETDRGVDTMIAAREQPQALRSLIHQIGLRQDATAHRHHGVGGEDEGAAQLIVEL